MKWASYCGVRSRPFLPPDLPPHRHSAPAIPLARWADRQLKFLGAETGSAAIAALSGTVLLGERARLNGFDIPGQVSAGGGCRFLATQDDWLAINLARDADRELLPALFEQGDFNPGDDAALARLAVQRSAAKLIERGREMGLALARLGEVTGRPPIELLTATNPAPPPQRAPLVLDLSALWAGPLCGQLLQLAGATVVKLEDPARPDAMRKGDPGLFGLLNQGKASVAARLKEPAVRALIERADIVIEAARPRALAQLGIDAVHHVAAHPGKVWITITGHGASGAQADWVGFGDDCGVAGGLSAALLAASGKLGFVGDAIADPLTGIAAARAAWSAWTSGKGGRIGVAMSGVIAAALAEEQDFDADVLRQELRDWARAEGQPFPAVTPRQVRRPVRPLGANNQRWLPC